MGTGFCSRRQKGLLQTIFCLIAMIVLASGAFLYDYMVQKAKESEVQALKFKQQQEALSAQLQVVYEHRSRLERSLLKERGEHKKTKEDFLVYKLEAQEALNKEKQDSMNRYGALNSQHTILKNQHVELKKQLTDLHSEHSNLKLEHQKTIESHKQSLSRAEREKDGVITGLQDSVSKLREESKLLRKAHQDVHSQLLSAQVQVEEFRQLKNTLKKMPSFRENDSSAKKQLVTPEKAINNKEAQVLQNLLGNKKPEGNLLAVGLAVMPTKKPSVSKVLPSAQNKTLPSSVNLILPKSGLGNQTESHLIRVNRKVHSLTTDKKEDKSENRPNKVPQQQENKVPQQQDNKVPQKQDNKVPQKQDNKVPQKQDNKVPQKQDNKVPLQVNVQQQIKAPDKNVGQAPQAVLVNPKPIVSSLTVKKPVPIQSWQDLVKKVNDRKVDEDDDKILGDEANDTNILAVKEERHPLIPAPNMDERKVKAKKKSPEREEMENDAGMIDREENLQPPKRHVEQEPLFPKDGVDPAGDPNNQGEDEFEEAEIDRIDFEEKTKGAKHTGHHLNGINEEHGGEQLDISENVDRGHKEEPEMNDASNRRNEYYRLLT
uniref:Golgi integral membrane protein 4 n=1 Tax=Leptobrachium leishanense TaxID=445787 RepID=A0A8C5WCT4_9ANUR